MKYAIIILLCLVSCSTGDFFEDKEFVYTVTNNKSENVDTLKVKNISKFFKDKLELKFKYKLEGNENLFIREAEYSVNSDNIKIKSPIGGYLNSTEYLPYPEIELPPKMNDTIDSEHEIPRGIPGESSLITGYQVVTDYINYSNNFIEDSVWVVELHNKENNRYNGKYYYSKEYGFVYFQYIFDDLKVEIELLELIKSENL